MAVDADFDEHLRKQVVKARRFATKRKITEPQIALGFTIGASKHEILKRLAGNQGYAEFFERLIVMAEKRALRIADKATSRCSENDVVTASKSVHDRHVTSSPRHHNA